jgi:hypothetical protein
MSTVAEIIEAVKKLNEREKGELLDRLAEVNFEDAWDLQIAADARAGRLDKTWAKSLKDIAARRIKPLDEIIDNS